MERYLEVIDGVSPLSIYLSLLRSNKGASPLQALL